MFYLYKSLNWRLFVQRDQIFIRPGASWGVRRAVALHLAGGVSKGVERVILVLSLVLTYVSMVWLLYGFSAELPLPRQLVALATASASALLLEWLCGMCLRHAVRSRLAYALAKGSILRFDPAVFFYWKIRLREHTKASLAWLETTQYDALYELYKCSRQPDWRPQDAQVWFDALLDQFLITLAASSLPAEPEQNNNTAYVV